MWTTPNDVIKRWVGGDSPSEASPVLVEIIADAEDEILRHYPKIQVRIDSNELPLRRVQRVVSDVVQRAYKIAGDYRTSYSETSGPFAQSASYGSDTPRTVRLTADEVSMLAPQSDSGAYTLNMAPDWGRESPGHDVFLTDGWAT